MECSSFTMSLVGLNAGNLKFTAPCRIVLADVAMIMLGLFGALSTNEYRWGYYGVSCAFFFIVLWGLFFPCLKGVRARGGQVTPL